MMERQFTDAYIRSLKPRSSRYEEFRDGGFGIRVTPKGLKTFLYRYRINGQRHFITIGHYPAMSLSEAKKRFIDLSDIRHGEVNPKEQIAEQKQKDQSTVKNLILHWYANYIEKHRAQPLQIWQHIKVDIIPLLGNKKLEHLKTREITQALDKIVGRGSPVHANKVLSTLKQAFNYAVSRGEMLLNPAMTIRARDIGGIEKPRERYLTLDEVKTLWQFLDSEEHSTSFQIRAALKIILLTGVRTGEIRVAKWSEFDFENSLWTIPAENTKTNIVMRIHLTELTKKVLRELKAHSNSEYVITGADDQSILSDRAMPRAVIRIQSRVGIPHWTAHDLRRTFATQLGEALHVDPVVIEKCLGHKMPKIMATYNKNEMLPQRKEALIRWEERIKQLIESDSPKLAVYCKDALNKAEITIG
ncbi:tyrosine-type recombinase/integrase [Legionella pneumophila serogroup 1]|uniref:tyrosine-type recombinase/integrase n=1 Tax=Legionella pneumophila TaxID=446 RepID=UPI0009B213E1|nr:site-specific integrase [Legionella pneumophila]HAT8827421.1 tyrosine-type recombinase/integrase [Legionella pneumophila subsp. pneumophila]WAI78716.1 tyrosine-type recombinase/integrase [Legionella pneumophila]HAT4692461.1 tyrosine-type recombinase/integrase [Legionella pneumophila]HAT9529639.1 tyrosine-type recombinase/integrase [Legionella pneumophila subsp. pneumophila]HAU0765710.1 tyrosine-type recombinase/integrase [Legionella pneumophila]